MKAQLVVIIVTALAAFTCGATILRALFRQFGPAAAIVVYFLIMKFQEPSGA